MLLGIAALIASLAFVVALVIVAILALLQVRRTAQTAEQTLATVDRSCARSSRSFTAWSRTTGRWPSGPPRDLREVEGLALMAQEVLSPRDQAHRASSAASAR